MQYSVQFVLFVYLQVHYRKVHSYSDLTMPTIYVKSVEGIGAVAARDLSNKPGTEDVHVRGWGAQV